VISPTRCSVRVNPGDQFAPIPLSVRHGPYSALAGTSSAMHYRKWAQHFQRLVALLSDIRPPVLGWSGVSAVACEQATVVGFGEQGALLHVDVAAGDARPVTVTAFVPLAELSWARVQSAHDAVEVRA